MYMLLISMYITCEPLIKTRPGQEIPFLSHCRGAYTPVLAKHSWSFALADCISVGVDRMQRSF